MESKKEIQAFNLSPQTFEQAMQYAKLIADSDLAPKDFKGKPANVLIAMQMGSEIGLKPMQAIQNIAVINGRPCLWGDAMLALVKAHPEFEDIQETVENGVATCIGKRKGQSAQTRTFSKEDAKKAGLLGKAGPWTNYESRMLQLRARGFLLRDLFPDALKGLKSAEEEKDHYHSIETAYEIVEEEKSKMGSPLSISSTIDNTIVHEHLMNISGSMNINELKKSYMTAMKELSNDKNAINKVIEEKNRRKLELEKMEIDTKKETNDLSQHAEFIQALGDE